MIKHVGSTVENALSEDEEAAAECSCGWTSGNRILAVKEAQEALERHYQEMKLKMESTL